VEGIQQCLKLKDLPDTSIALLHHTVWQIYDLLQPPATLNYITQHHWETVANITTCLLCISDDDAHTTSISLKDHIPVFPTVIIMYSPYLTVSEVCSVE